MNKNSGFGALLANALHSIAPTTGKVFVVGDASTVYLPQLRSIFGGDPDGQIRFQTTVTLALAQCVADRGDVILVAPGHAETISTAAGIAINKSGVTIIGLGNGALRPTFTFATSTAATITVTAANVTIKNCLFVNNINALASMLSVTAADFSFINNEVVIGTASIGLVTVILTAATADRLKVEDNRFYGPATTTGTTATAMIKHEAGVDYVIRNNYFAGKMTQAIVNVATILRGLIDSNRFVIGTGTAAITMASGSTPFIVNNFMNVASGTAPIVAAAGFVAGNRYSAAAGVTAGTAVTI